MKQLRPSGRRISPGAVLGLAAIIGLALGLCVALAGLSTVQQLNSQQTSSILQEDTAAPYSGGEEDIQADS